MRFEGAQNYDDAVGKAAEESGIQRNYWDIFHKLHEPTVEVRRQILRSLGWNVQSLESVEEGRGRLFEEGAARTRTGYSRAQLQRSLRASVLPSRPANHRGLRSRARGWRQGE